MTNTQCLSAGRWCCHDSVVMARPHRMSKHRTNCHHVCLAFSYVHLFKWKLHTLLSHERTEAGKHVKFQVKRQVLIYRSIQSSEPFKALYTLLPWQTCSLRHHLGFSGKHPAICTINVRRLIVHISTHVYSQVLIYTAEWTGVM